MKDWEEKRLGDLCKISTGNSNTEDAIESGDYAFFDRSKIIKRSSKYLFDCDAIIIAGEGATFLPKFYSGKFDLHQRAYAIFNFNDTVDIQFAFKYLIHFHKYFEKVAVGATAKSLRLRHFQDLPIPIPPLAEQKRIVAILDEAFTAIAKAKENTEKNLQNAKELFQSELKSIFTNKGEGWEEKKLAEIALTFGRGKSKNRPRNDIKLYGGKYPFIQTGDVRNADKFIVQYSQTYNEVGLAQSKLWYKGTICITIAANIAETGILDFDSCFPDSMIGLVVDPKKADVNYTYYALQFLKATLQLLGKGSAQDNINMGTFETQTFPFPKLEIQKKIAYQLDTLSVETKKLEAISQQKLNALEELKKSMLQKAFTGELNINVSIEKAIEPPMLIPGISTTDLQAGLTVIALQKHLEKGKENTFHHVKAEKIINTIQYHLNIELDRTPVKDAAGPNDFVHVKNKVEPRAAKAGFYTVTKKDAGYYIYNLGRQASKIAEKTKTCLNDNIDTLDWLIGLMIPMNTEQAEIVATTYAAWNNLLIDGLPTDEEAIVCEARENWHEKKLDIPREKFFKAIDWMKSQNLVPKGSGKKILPKLPGKRKK